MQWLIVVFIVLVALLLWSLYSMAGPVGLAALVGFLAVVALSRKWLGALVFQRAFRVPFALKGKVLRGAQLRIHSVSRTDLASLPEGYEEADEEAAGDKPAIPRVGYTFEATVTPRPSSGPFHTWEVGELMLVPAGTRRSMPGGNAQAWRVLDLHVWDEAAGRWLEDEGFKIPGAHRLKFSAAIPESARRVRLRYYFELFGDINLPPE